MDCPLIRSGIWSRAMQAVKSRTSSIKLNNPFVNEKPFIPSYEKDPTIYMDRLYHFDYYQTWRQEHDEYLTKRKLKFEVPKKQFPIYQKRVRKQPDRNQIDMAKMANKKYTNVKPKVKTFFYKK